ncbi:capsule biosynthesis protein [Rhodobacter sp. NSM]|uniref:capsule biosynthesis protein n=1 Tax=Rhodobacter sp. NSM TaxID=3457501 RepID=UPI003FD20191
MAPPARRRFLFLQGPHGPFFHQLGRRLAASGADVLRVGFNLGDSIFWPDRRTYIPFRDAPATWPATFCGILARRGITDIVLYGDTRPVHAQAIAIAKARGLTVHVFEEGYLRPYWVTYERGGSNGHSRLMRLTLCEMRDALEPEEQSPPEAPARWGDLVQHILWGAIYHALVLGGARAYPRFQPHRSLTVTREFRLHLRRLVLSPIHRLERMAATARILLGRFSFHLVLLQLEHDSSFTAHGPYASMADFLSEVIRAFAEGAPPDHHLVLKAHPLEDGRAPIPREIRRLAHLHGLTGRVHFVRGGKLARLLSRARSAVTVNSTAGQQALWRDLPVRTLGTSVYGLPELVSSQPLPAFFARPRPPEPGAYRIYRRFLLRTSQVPGGFYSVPGRKRLLDRICGMMTDPLDPYAALIPEEEADRQQLRTA